MKTPCVVRGPILRLGEVGLPSSRTLDLLMTLLVVLLRIEKAMACPTFSLMPTNQPVSSVDLLGKLLSSELK